MGHYCYYCLCCSNIPVVAGIPAHAGILAVFVTMPLLASLLLLLLLFFLSAFLHALLL
jgi:hypothetical protein